MQYLETFVAMLKELSFFLQNDPLASAITGVMLGAVIILVPALFLKRRNAIKSARLEDERNRKFQSLQESLSLKTINLATVERTCEEQKRALANADEQITKLEQSAKTIPVLEEKIEQQLRQIEALTDAMVSEFNFNPSTETGNAPVESPGARESLTKQAVIDQLSDRLYLQLSTLHQQIADQCQLITELQAELDARREGVAQQIITKSHELPKIARTRLDRRVIEPIQMRFDGLRQSVQSIPDQTRAKLDQMVILPIHRRVNEIKTSLHRIPAQASAQLSRIVLDPLNEFIHSVNRSAKNVTANSQEKVNRMITKQLENLITQLKMMGPSLSSEMLENLNRIIVRPLERLLAEIRQRATALPGQGAARFNDHVVRPAIQKLRVISESRKQASIDGIKQAGHWVIDAVARRSAPAAAT